MAEFQEVMRQWVRARKATASNLDGNVLSVYPLEDYDDRLIADIEKNVMAWAAEHPEPVYETWLEFIKRFETGGRKSDDDFIYWMAITSIPADIAQKLGIEPKAGGET